MERQRARRIVEAALFLSPRPLTLAELSKIAGIPPEEVDSIVNEIASALQSVNSAIIIERYGNAVRMYVAPDVLPHVRHLAPVPEFTKKELEIVAYIAVKGSALRSELRKMYSGADRVIEKLRSLGAVILRKKGRTYEVRKTELFDRYFGTTR